MVETTAGGAGFWQRIGSLGGRTLTVLAVLAVLVAAADRSGLLSDWSSDRRFTLSPRLTLLITAQNEPVELVGIWTADQRSQDQLSEWAYLFQDRSST